MPAVLTCSLTVSSAGQRIYIALPEAPARAHMFKVHLGDTPNALTQQDFDELGRRTEGFSGSDVAVVVKDVLMEPVRKTQDATHFRCGRIAQYWHPACTVLLQSAPSDALLARKLRGVSHTRRDV